MEILKKIADAQVFSCYESQGKIAFIDGASRHFEVELDSEAMAALAGELRALVNDTDTDTKVLDKLSEDRVFGVYCEDNDGSFTFQEQADYHFEIKLSGEDVLALASEIEAKGLTLAGPAATGLDAHDFLPTTATGQGLGGRLENQRVERVGDPSNQAPAKPANKPQ